jgi:hypothetical protein
MRFTSTIALLLLLCHTAYAATLPAGLTPDERVQTAKLVSSSTSLRSAQLHRSLSSMEGLDLSLSLETLPLSELPEMGTSSERLDDKTYVRLQVSKGLYRKLDLSLYLTPLNPSTPLSNYGGRLRWTFYQNIDQPLFLAWYVDLGGTNLNDQLLIQTMASGFQLGFKRKLLSLSFFAGTQRTYNRFRGGAEGVTDSGHLESHRLTSYTLGLGGIYDFKSWYIGFAVDRQHDTLMSAKVGKVF